QLVREEHPADFPYLPPVPSARYTDPAFAPRTRWPVDGELAACRTYFRTARPRIVLPVRAARPVGHRLARQGRRHPRLPQRLLPPRLRALAGTLGQGDALRLPLPRLALFARGRAALGARPARFPVP